MEVKKTVPAKAATKKATAKKKPVKKGAFMRSSVNGISVHVHANNGNKLAVMTGYNTPANMQKGLAALHEILDKAKGLDGKYAVVDERKKPAKKKA